MGGRENVYRISQIILQKHYTKMKQEKIVSISVGKTVPKNAPIKYSEIVEGQSDADEDEEEDISTNIQSPLNSGRITPNNESINKSAGHLLNVS